MKLGFVILFIISVVPKGNTAPRAITHEDIRDAILSIVHMFRDSTEKLERHEYRERQLGEQLKKALSVLDKRERAQDDVLKGIATNLKKIDERLQIIEIANSNKQREKETYAVDMVPLQSWMSNMEGMLQEKQSKEQGSNHDQLSELQTSVNSRLDTLYSTIEKIEENLLQPTPQQHIEKLYHKLESQLATQNDWHNIILTTLESHQGVLSALQANMSPNNDVVVHITEKFDSIKQEFKEDLEKETEKLQQLLQELMKSMEEDQDTILKSLAENNEMSAGFYEIIHKSYNQLSTEVKALGKVEKVLIQTADNVMDTKRRIEYGVQQILLEVGDLVKLQGKDLNITMNKRFDGISEKILDNQNGALTNLSSKIETEISQVWRQIGIMYQQLTASAGALDRLQQQTEIYVNGSLQTMDSMEGKVGQITGRMSEVDDNLNYLLGRLSLVTHEFNQIKSALATALDNIRSSFHTVHDKIKEVGPGPNPIEHSDNPELDDNTL